LPPKNHKFQDFNNSAVSDVENATIDPHIPFTAHWNLRREEGFEQAFAYLTRNPNVSIEEILDQGGIPYMEQGS
jgi:hypothetical protein